MSRAVNELCNMKIVCEHPAQTDLNNSEHCKQLLSDALMEIALYLKLHEQTDIICSIQSNEDNLVRKFFCYLCDNIKEIRRLLANHGIGDNVPITQPLLDNFGIWDLFNLHQFEGMFKEIEQVLQAQR